MPALVPIALVTSAIGAGAGTYTAIKSAKEQKEFAKKQEETQKKLKAEQLAKRKKKIDLMRKELLAPSLLGGKRSLTSGSEMGIKAEQRGVLG